MNTSDSTYRPDGRGDGSPPRSGLGWRYAAFFVALLTLNYILAALFFATAPKPRVTIPYQPDVHLAGACR